MIEIPLLIIIVLLTINLIKRLLSLKKIKSDDSGQTNILEVEIKQGVFFLGWAVILELGINLIDKDVGYFTIPAILPAFILFQSTRLQEWLMLPKEGRFSGKEQPRFNQYWERGIKPYQKPLKYMFLILLVLFVFFTVF